MTTPLSCFQADPLWMKRDNAPLQEGPLYRHHHWPDNQADNQSAARQTASLAGIVVVLLLLVGGLFLVQQLRTASMIEDCLLSGRRNCDALVIKPR
jgi:hypothetical protein